MKVKSYFQVFLLVLIYSFSYGCGQRSKPRTGPHRVIVLEMDTLSPDVKGKSNPASLQLQADTVIQIIERRLVIMGIPKDSMETSVNKNHITFKFWHLTELRISMEHLRRVLQASAKLGFWETWKARLIADSIYSAANKNDSTNKIICRWLPTVLSLNSEQFNSKYGSNTAEIGFAHARDTSNINTVLKRLHNLPADIHFCWGVNPKEGTDIHSLFILKGREPALSNQIIDKAEASRDDNSGGYLIEVTMNKAGALKWGELTKKNTGEDIAITLDDLVYICPRVMTEISGGRVQITGSYSRDEARDLAAVLSAGYIPVQAKIVEENMEQ